MLVEGGFRRETPRNLLPCETKAGAEREPDWCRMLPGVLRAPKISCSAHWGRIPCTLEPQLPTRPWLKPHRTVRYDITCFRAGERDQYSRLLLFLKLQQILKDKLYAVSLRTGKRMSTAKVTPERSYTLWDHDRSSKHQPEKGTRGPTLVQQRATFPGLLGFVQSWSQLVPSAERVLSSLWVTIASSPHSERSWCLKTGVTVSLSRNRHVDQGSNLQPLHWKLPGNICLSSPKLRLSFAVLYEMGRLPVAKAKDYDKYDGAFDRLRSLVTPKAGPPQGDRMVLGPMKGVTELQGPPLGNLTSSGSVVLWGGCLQSALSWGGSCAEDGLMMSISPQWMLLIVHSASSYILLFPESMVLEPENDEYRNKLPDSPFRGVQPGVQNKDRQCHSSLHNSLVNSRFILMWTGYVPILSLQGVPV
ncbi:hypothetical protein MJT46_009878 [Ovis ammon polii x Ovis aries]|nr:hypothetical protein MJT46_009878 [Ovis ammon polii x Ovis aries]